MRHHHWTSAAIALLFFTVSAQADIRQSLLDCKQLTDDTARLSCYDRIGSTLTAAQMPKAAQTPVAATPATRETPAPVIAPAASTPLTATAVAPQPSAEIIEADFGKTQSRPSDQVEQLQATVKSLSRNKMRKMLITLENGHVWRQTEDDSIQLNAGDSVTIEKASFGSFLLSKTGTNRKVRVKRVE